MDGHPPRTGDGGGGGGQSLLSQFLNPLPVSQIQHGAPPPPYRHKTSALGPAKVRARPAAAHRAPASVLNAPDRIPPGWLADAAAATPFPGAGGGRYYGGGGPAMESVIAPNPEWVKLQQALNVDQFVGRVNALEVRPVNRDDSSDDDSDVLQAYEDEARVQQVTRQHVKAFDRMKKCRRYIDTRRQRDSDESSDDDDGGGNDDLPDKEFQDFFRMHVKRKKMRRKIRATPEELDAPKKPKKRASDAGLASGRGRSSKLSSSPPDFPSPSALGKLAAKLSKIAKTGKGKKDKKERKGKKGKRDKEKADHQLKSRRKRLWTAIVKKELSKAQKARNYNQKERLAQCKRAAQQCMRAVRQKAMASQRAAKETQWRAKRLTREMQAHWKKYDRAEKQQKRQQEREAEEQQKQDLQLLEAKRQQRKLNFLITQTELYAHFIANKIGGQAGEDSAAEEDAGEREILGHLEEERPQGRMAEIDDYDSQAVQTMARNNASQALERHQERTRAYDDTGPVPTPQTPLVEGAPSSSSTTPANEERSQPKIFSGTLKAYQLKGMNWLMNLYDQGINGILADEMGLGKTVQALSMLASIAEKYNIWGPFLVITPASTLHNWQQEVAKFVPDFKVVPYWGSPQERKTLRHFWDQKHLHTKQASFHLVITSYQLVITDFKYFNRIKWQYLVLDEAQAIKSSSSQRWKMLLEFKCRNRLLLSGTPIQNSMAELWSLLHFVMPTIFDSHDEFNDWFSKDIESSAESKGQVDEKQISRLHLILKPFMLRRIKKDVENELTDKLEVLMYCPLTIRQKLLYMGLKRKIRIEDLLQGCLGSQAQNSSLTTSLMNLVMQFRKVCNHPELFERREARSPFVMDIGPYVMPKLLYRENIHTGAGNPRAHLLNNRLCVFHPENVHRSLFKRGQERLEVSSSAFSYLRFVDDPSPGEHFRSFRSLLALWLRIASEISARRRRHHEQTWQCADERRSRRHLRSLLVSSPTCPASVETSPALSAMVFTGHARPVLGHADVRLHKMPETVKHRLMRLRNKELECQPHSQPRKSDCDSAGDDVPPPPDVLAAHLCHFPAFLYDGCPRVATPGRHAYAYDRGQAYAVERHNACTSRQGLESVWLGSPQLAELQRQKCHWFHPVEEGGIRAVRPGRGFSNIVIPDKQTLVSDSGKLHVLDGLLARLKQEGHRVLIYSQMTRMIDLLEEYMAHRQHTFMRLDGSSKIHERRDMVADFQQRADIFAFLLSTRAGGLGINLTAADTVIFYDSDWNPTVDQQAMDRAHRLGQTKQVTVYRLVCKGTIEERILQRAREKSEIQRMVIQGGSFKGKPGELRPKEVVSLLLDDDEIERKYKAGAEVESPATTASNGGGGGGGSKKKRPTKSAEPKARKASDAASPRAKRPKMEGANDDVDLEDDETVVDENYEEEEDESSGSGNGNNNAAAYQDDSSQSMDAFVDVVEGGGGGGDSSREATRPSSPLFDFMGEKLGPKRSKRGGGGKRGRPRGALKGRLGREDSPAAATPPVLAVHNGGGAAMAAAAAAAAAKRGPGRPRSSKAAAGPLNKGSRGPAPKVAKMKNKINPNALAAKCSYPNAASASPPKAAMPPTPTGPRFYTETSDS